MGEYANYLGDSLKIGTCEDMWYLRADQARAVQPEEFSVDPVRDARHLRFRFPWPDEDHIAPGAFEDHNRRLPLWGMTPPAELADSHRKIQFKAPHGYLASLPCPESGRARDGVRVHRNGFRGAVFLAQQRLHDGMLVPVLYCACDMGWRVPTPEDAADLFAALDREDNRLRDSYVEPLPAGHLTSYQVIAERVRKGFDPDHVAALFT